MRAYFHDKVVLITGSGQGIGKATAALIGSYGAKICINGRNADKLRTTGEELSSMGIDCLEVASDLSTPQGCETLIQSCISHFGRLDILINNAGIASRGRIAELTPDAWDHTMKVNFNSAVHTTYFALPHLLKQRGQVMIISSMAAKVGIPGHASYSASKMALTAYARALQNEYKKSDLHCGLVFVGFTENEDVKEVLAPDGSYKSLPKRSGIKLASRESVAKSIVQAISLQRQQTTLTFLGKLQHVMLKFIPAVVYAALRKAYKGYDQMYK